ncbi:MAG TPA: DUF6305 family protein [Vicinamibacterales bacterium]|nr:DUF6305 family protein [Vicinamibacterales bacterium]HOG28418.1 DUF6305 family protein [Vicinamibacterales bacterium]HOQ59316.1 DUF6305 family protein [Vicinamibacterales bacterium]HPK71638.1 DUF6305 family protein [Vicinamibacterales bacterium]HPW21840.1 DUF6305 family protein [Vicinamibacterales bacterium]
MAGRHVVRLAAVAFAVLACAVPAADAQAVFETPGLITSAGQSSDVAIIKVMLNTQLKLGLEYKPIAQPSDLAGMKALVVSVGASTKGLGAAGLDMPREIARTTALLKAAKSEGLRVLVLHTGGEARRGKTSNDLIQAVLPLADHVVVVAAGNKDKLFTTLGEKHGVPVTEVAKLADAGGAVRALFKQ